MSRFIIVVVFSLVVLSVYGQDRPTGRSFITRSEVLGSNGMVATSQPLASQVALEILKKGGTAVDAAIAANACLGLMEPTGSGIGGDLFAIVWDAGTGRLYGLNASGRSPKSLTLEYFKQHDYDKIPLHGPLPVSVPGCVDGWFELHKRFGQLSMETILEPAIQYARKGFPVTEVIGLALQRNVRILSKYPGIEDTYMSDGNAPGPGEIFKNPYLANTLEKIAKEGRDVFYKGEIARTIAAYMKKQGGFLGYEDMASHKSEWIDPVSVSYRGYEVWELPPNGQGIAALQMLNILEGYNLSEMGFGSAMYMHLFIEAKKMTYEDRAKYYADPAFNDIPVEWLVSKDYASLRRKLIDVNRSAVTYPSGVPDHGETVYLCTADRYGNWVSLIQSNYLGMGSGMCPDGLGFVLQDRGALFSLEKGHFNIFESGKRPFHTIIPAFVTKGGKPYMSFGVMGGAMQPQGHVQVLINIIDFGMGLQEAGDAPRINHSGSSQPTGVLMTGGGFVNIESGFDYEVIRKLMQKGHKIGYRTGVYGGYQAISWDDENKVYHGASESRKDGQAVGY